jgi:RHH-type transcriptional regulator, rel operon repressor / antitoxin RelB
VAIGAETMTTITVRVPEKLRDRYDALARATDRNRQYHALEALRRYLDDEAWQIELITERLRQIDTGEIGYASSERVAAVLNKYGAYDGGRAE